MLDYVLVMKMDVRLTRIAIESAESVKVSILERASWHLIYSHSFVLPVELCSIQIIIHGYVAEFTRSLGKYGCARAFLAPRPKSMTESRQTFLSCR